MMQPHSTLLPSTRRQLIGGAAAFALGSPKLAFADRSAGLRSAALPRWRGFNFPDRMHFQNTSFQQADFDTVAEWGFDFVRLPLDYRIWTTADGQFDEPALRQLETVIGWGKARNIHVNLCLHRAPGYSVQGVIDSLQLWGDGPNGEEARRQFVGQWRMLASRFKSFGPEALSFNLVNEPPVLAKERYLDVVASATKAIHDVDPARLVIADGCGTAGSPWMTALPELAKIGAAESIHVYFPTGLTQFHAGWYARDDTSPPPVWPTKNVLSGFLCGPAKAAFHAPLAIKGDFSKDTRLALEVELVDDRVRLVIKAGNAVILDQILIAGPEGQGPYKASMHEGSGKGYYQAIFDEPLSAVIPAGAQEISIEVVDGDWMTFSNIHIGPWPAGSQASVDIPASTYEWVKNPPFALTREGALVPDSGPARYDEKSEFEALAPWRQLLSAGVGVHVGEFGANNRTPHAATLAWMHDNLATFQKCGFGWALWTLHGPFGVLDSGRADVNYETYKGHKLDRAMLELLRAY